MSVSLWAYDDLKCDGYPCPGSCDICPVKDEHRCYECKHYTPAPLYMMSSWGDCAKGGTTKDTAKACEDFEEKEDD